MPDPIKDLYNSLKSTKLFLDENDFRQQLNKSPKEVFNVVSKEKQTSGLFIDYDDFENATGLKKKISEKVSKTGGKAGTFAPLLEEEPPKKEKLTYSDIEQVFADVNKADKRLANLQKSQITSAGIGAAPAIIPQADIDAATKDLSLVNKRKAEVLGSYQKELAAPVSRLLQTGEYKNFFDGDVYNQGKARNFFREITKKYGGGEYLVDTWTAELKKQGQFEKDKPRFSNLFDEELSKVGLSTDSITKMKGEAGQKLFDRLAKNQYDNVDLIKRQTTEEADAVLAQAKNDANVTVQEFNGYVEGLNKRLAAGEITAEQAASMYDEGLKNVNSGIKAVNDNYLDLVRNINVRANKKFGRIETELKRIGQTISDADILKELPESDRNKIKNATEKAAIRLSKEKNDIKKAALSAFTKSVPGASEWASNLSDSFISGFNRGLANLGDYLHMEGANNKLVDFLRDKSSTADKFASPKYEWNKNEWLNRAITSTATSLGASAPALLPTLGVGLISGGVGALPVLATGTTSFAIENAQNAGQQYQQKLEETGDVNIARKSATDLFNKNTIALPFYFLGGLGDMMLLKSSGIKKKIAGFGLEQAEEVPTEYIQSYNEAVEGGYKKSITEYIKENPEIAVDTLVSTIGQGATMSSMGNAMASFSKKVPESSSQFFANIIQKEGLEFAQKVLEKYYTTGTIDKAQYESQKAILEQTAQRLGKIEELGVVSKPDTILINALSSKVSDLKSKIEAEKDESIKAIYQKQLNDANSDIAQLAENKLPYVSFTMPGGMGDVRVMTVKEFQALPESEANELIKNSDGVQVVNDDALNTSLADKKKQLGIPKDAPEGAYPNNEPAQPQIPAAPTQKYRVEYFDPEKGEMTHSYFDSMLEGDTFISTLTDAQKSKGVKAYFELTTEPSFGEEPQVPAAPEKPIEATKITEKGNDLILSHGTKHDFDKFQLEKIGTGEGAQAFGYGLYFTDGSKIAEGYAKKLSEDGTGLVYSVKIKDGKSKNWADWRKPLDESIEADFYDKLTDSEKKQYKEYIDDAFELGKDKDYTGDFGDLEPSQYGLIEYPYKGKPSASGNIYQDLKDVFGQEKATEIFKRAGIDGIKYESKGGFGKENNYVVFNPESIEIIDKKTQVPAAPVTEEKIKTEEDAIPEPSPEGVLQPEQERIGEEGGERRGVESPVERVAAAQEGKVEAAKKEVAKREKTYAPPEGRQLEVNKLVQELYKFNQQKRGRLGLKTIESLKKRNELLIEAKRLGFETKVDREGRVYVKKARAVDKSNSNMAIDSKFVPLEKRSEKLRNLYNKIQGLSQKYGWDFQSFMPNVIVGADGKKMNNKQIANALKDLENGIPSKGANLILNDLEAMAESGVIEVRDGQNLIGLPIDEFFKELERVAEGDIDRVLGEEVETLPETDLVKWFEEMEAEQQFESEIYEEPITPEALPEGGVQPEAKKEVPKPVRPTAAKPAGEAGRGAPPTEGGPKPTPTEEGEPRRLSGIKKGLVSKEVLEGVDLDRTGDKQLLMAGKQIIESGEVEPKLLIDKIIDEGRGVLSPAEVVALITYKADLDTKIEDLTSEIEQLEASGQEIGTKGVELKNLQVEQRNFEIAAVITAQQQSMSFRLRRWMLDRTYSLQQQIAQYKKANGGVISPEVLEQFEKMDAEIQELKKQIKEAEERKVDQEGQVAVENIIEDVKREDARTLTDEEIDAKVQKGVQEEINKIYEQLPAKRKSRADQAIAALERIQKRLRSRTYDASIGIPVAIIDMGITTIKKALKAGVAIEKAIELGIDKIKDALKGKPFNNEDKFRKDLLDGFKAEGVKTEKEVPETPTINEDGTITIPEKFLRDLVRKGINTIDGLTDAAFKELESQLPGLTKRQVRDAITQYGKTVNPSQDEVRQQLAAAKRLGRLISELEDLKSMSKTEFALKYFKKPTPSKITEAEKNLKKQINSLARDLKTDAQVLSQAKESAKKRIEELQRRLKEKDYASRPKPLVKADAELEILLGKKQALQDKFEEEKKKAELKNRTFGQRIEDIALEIFSGISRALVAGLDLSAAFVQGTRRVFTNPVMSAKAFAEGLRQFASPTRMERFMQRYKGTYNYSVARNSGLAISDVDGTLSAKEQIFVVQWANTIYDLIASVITLGHKPSAEFIKRINPLKASQRAFDGYMNYIRISSFEAEMAALKNMGYTPDSNPEVYKSAADFVNTATGRANMGPLEASSKWLSVIMFAPRKVASELKLYSPLAFLYYGYMPAPVRKRALIDFAKFSASVLVTHALVKAAIDTYGGDEEDYEDFWNSDSPNFLAFKIGDKRISFLGGIKSTIVFMSRLFGQDFVDQYGITTKFGERYGKRIDTKKDLTIEFLLGKASPGAGAIRDYLDKNPNYENDDEILQNLVVPMWIQDANELYKEDPIAVTAMFNMLAIIGANIRKVDMKQVQDQIIFKEKINKKEVKRVVKLTDAQKEEFQNIVKERAKIELDKIAPIVKKEKSGTKRAEYDKMAIDQAKKDAQEILEKRYIKLFRQFPVQEKEQEETKEKVKKKLK